MRWYCTKNEKFDDPEFDYKRVGMKYMGIHVNPGEFENGKRLISSSHHSYDLDLVDFLNIYNNSSSDHRRDLNLFFDLALIFFNIGVSKGYKLKTNEMKRTKGI